MQIEESRYDLDYTGGATQVSYQKHLCGLTKDINWSHLALLFGMA